MSDDKEPVLLAWLACSYAEQIEMLSDQEIIGRALTALRRVYGTDKVPDPVEYFITRWKLDPYSRGSWSGKIKMKFNFFCHLLVGLFCSENSWIISRRQLLTCQICRTFLVLWRRYYQMDIL